MCPLSNADPMYLSFGFARVARPVGDSGTTGGVKVDVGELVLLVAVELMVWLLLVDVGVAESRAWTAV